MKTSQRASLVIADIGRQFERIVAKEKLKRMDTLVTALKEATPIDTGEARDGWRHNGEDITNNVEHIEFLNNGSSKQAPAHFVEKTLLEHEGISPRGIIVQTR